MPRPAAAPVNDMPDFGSGPYATPASPQLSRATPPDEVADKIVQVFKKHDKSGEGELTLSREQMKGVLLFLSKKTGRKVNPGQLDAIVDAFLADSSEEIKGGKIQSRRFVQWMWGELGVGSSLQS